MRTLSSIAASLCVLSLHPSTAADVTAEKTGTVVHFAIEGKSICDYQMEAGKVPEGVAESFAHGAHLHPIYSPSGKLVTGNHQADHPWQRGVWIGWTKTEFGDSHPDFWNMGKDGKIAAEVRFEKLVLLTKNGFTSQHVFLDHSHTTDEKVLNETWEVTVSQKTLDGTLANVIDLTSTQTCAGEEPLKLPKYHYGGLGEDGGGRFRLGFGSRHGGVLGVVSCGRLAIRSVRIADAAKGVFKAGGVGALHDLPRIGRHAAAQDDHLLGAEASAPLILACEAGHYLGIGSGEPDAIALNGGFTALLVSGLVLVDAHKRSQRPAVVAGEPLAQVFDEVFLAHGWRNGFSFMNRH